MLDQPKKILLLPIDNRPVTYVFSQLIASVAGVEAVVPQSSLLRSAQEVADITAFSDWLTTVLRSCWYNYLTDKVQER